MVGITGTRSSTHSAASTLLATVLLIAVWICAPSSALAQHEGSMDGAPKPPAGDGTLTVKVFHPSDPAQAEGLTVALYALGPDGQPGFANGDTDSQGILRFDGISTNPRIVYLIGVKYREIPFGERFAFQEGASSSTVQMTLSDPTEDFANLGIRVEELRARIDWMGDRVIVREVLRLINPSDKVVLLPTNDATRSITARRLPDTAQDFAPGPTAIGEGLGFVSGQVHFWGPLYPGDQTVEYQYSLPILGTGNSVPLGMREKIGRIVVVAGTDGLSAAGPGLIASSKVLGDRQEPLAAWAKADVAAGDVLEVRLSLPETRNNPNLLTMPRSDLWLEMDDTVMTARVDLQIEVEAGTPVSGTPAQPLFHVTIPTGASLEGVAPAAESLGLVPTQDSGFDVVGPIGPGSTSLGYSYRMPAGPGGVDLDLRVPRDVSTLNVLIADTGLELDSTRLHRRRPFRSGTRNFLHREAYNITSDEVVDLQLKPLSGAGLPREGAMALTILAAAAGAFFIFSPLRRAAVADQTDDGPLERIAAEREAAYSAIRDLDHDFETGKLDASDHKTMRSELRAQAIALLRDEREHTRAHAPDARPAADFEAGASTTTTAFCTHCGKPIDENWRFCSHCGGGIEPTSGKAG